MEPGGQIGSSTVIEDDMGRASGEDSRVAEGTRTWVVEHHMQAVVDRRQIEASGNHWEVDRHQVVVGTRRMKVACRSHEVVDGSHSLLEAHHNQAVAAPHRH